MLFFLYGEDGFRSAQKLKEIIERYRLLHQAGFNLRFFDFSTDSFEDFLNELKTRSIFKENRLLILKNVFSDEALQKKFLKEKERLLNPSYFIVFYEREKIKNKGPFFAFLKSRGQSQRFEKIKGKKLESWLIRKGGEKGLSFSNSGLKLLLEFAGNDLWRLENELNKLSNYGTKKIGIEEIELLVSPDWQNNIFSTIDLIASKNKNGAIKLIHRHLKKGDSPFYLFAMIAMQFRNIISAKERILLGRPLKDLGWHPFVAKKSASLAQKFSMKELKKIYQEIFLFDLLVKKGLIGPELALDLFIAKI